MRDVRSSAAIRAALKGYEPTDEQWDAIAHPLEPIHLVAGAGSGKTAVMAARIVWSIESSGFAPSQILGLTFTNKAAEELQERVRGALTVMGEHRPDDITVQTYHAFAAGIVREHGLLAGVEPEAGLLSEAQQWQLVLSCIDDLPPFEAIELRSPAGIVRATLDLASSLADHIVSVSDVIAADQAILSNQEASEDMRKTAQQRMELCHAVDAYTKKKAERQRIDFGDQVVKAVEILEGHPEVRDQYAQRYPVILLDEYQDTNVAQRRMMQALIGDRGTVTAVGDARQAIYAFRGATMYNLIGFPDHFPRKDRKLYEPISLSENFRSGQRILDIANKVVEGIDEERRPGKPLRAIEDNGEGNVALGLYSDERAEAAFIADECERLHGKPTREGRDPVAWRDLAILVRRKSTMDAILEALEERDIPVEVVGLAGLLKTPEVIEVVAWLRSLDGRPTANRWLARILLGPRWRIHYRDLALCSRWAAEQNQDLRLRLAGGDAEAARDLAPGDVGFSLAEALDHVDEIEGLGDEARSRLNAFNARLRDLRKKTHGPLLEIVQEVIRRAGIEDALEASSSRTSGAALQNLSNFLDHVAAFAPVEGEATLRTFLDYLQAADQAEETLEAMQPAESDSVKLMTVHSAKGLEFECVFVPAIASAKNNKGDHVYSIFPDPRSSNPLESYRTLPYEVREDKSHLPQWTGKLTEFKAAVKERAAEDERRLFYVALTRAKQRLYVTCSWWYGRNERSRGPSLFWEELRAHDSLVEVIEEAACPEANPIIEALAGRNAWPPQARAETEDPLFDDGPGPAADGLLDGSLTLESLTESLSAEEKKEFERLVAERNEELDLIGAAIGTNGGAAEPQLPEILYATWFVRLQKGDITPWDLLRPLPDRPTVARRLGTEVHRRIEERSRGMAPYPEESELDEPSEVSSDPSVMAGMLSEFEKQYGERTIARLPSGEPMIELPFTLKKDDRIIRGRIDAVYETEDGGLEIVDFKTGRRFEPKPGEPDQLELYAEALTALGLAPSGKIKLTYAFLSRPRQETK